MSAVLELFLVWAGSLKIQKKKDSEKKSLKWGVRWIGADAMESATKMKSASVVRSPSTSPTDLSLCSSKRKAISHQSSSNHHHHHHHNNNNNNNSKRFRLSEAAESGAEAEQQQQQQQQQRGRSLKSTALPATSSGASSPSRASIESHHQNAAAKMLGMPDQNTASMLAAMAFVTRARSSFMIGDILNSSRWTDPVSQSQQHGQQHGSHHHHHPLLGAYHHHQGGSHPAATAAALMAASAAAHHHVPQHLNQLPHGLHGLHHHHLLQHPSVMEAVHQHHQSVGGGGGHHHNLLRQRDAHSSKSEEEEDADSEVDVESNASYNSRQTNSRELSSNNSFMGVLIVICPTERERDGNEIVWPWMPEVALFFTNFIWLAVIGRALSTHLYH